MTGKHSSVHRWYQQAVREIDLTKHWGGGAGLASLAGRWVGVVMPLVASSWSATFVMT